MDYGFLNIEMSLACNAKCAMCCVDAPAWRGDYDLYDNLYRLVNSCKPKTMLVQGGEILIQKSSLEWLERVHEEMPSMKLWLVTNGNVELSMMDRMEQLFDKITISILGFQMETYRTITGLELFRMKELAEKLIQRGNVSVIAKFLYSPISLHEIPLFLEWIAGVGMVEATINDASTMSYLNMNTDDNYWNKIAERTAKEIKRTIVENADNYRKQGTRIGFDTPARATFHIDDKFLVKHELGDVLYSYLS